MGLRNQQGEKIVPSEPIQPKKECAIQFVDVEGTVWTAKEGAGEFAGKDFGAMKVQVSIVDKDISTENPDAKPKLVFDDVFNIETYPYEDKKTGSVRWMSPNKLYQLQEAFGFETVYKDSQGNVLEPRVSKAGKKYAPKGEDVHRHLNQDFLDAYFDSNDKPVVLNWVNKTIKCNIDYKKQSQDDEEQYGKKNTVSSYLASS